MDSQDVCVVQPSRTLDNQTIMVLERLMMARGQSVPTRTLIDYLYPERHPPGTADAVVRQSIWKARKALPEGAITFSRTSGYKLHFMVELPRVDRRTREDLLGEQKLAKEIDEAILMEGESFRLSSKR